MLSKGDWARLTRISRPTRATSRSRPETPCAGAPDFARCIMERAAGEYPITRAQREIAILIVLGDSNDLIAAERGISKGAVANQLTQIYRAADVCCRCEFQGDFLRRALRLCARDMLSSR